MRQRRWAPIFFHSNLADAKNTAVGLGLSSPNADSIPAASLVKNLFAVKEPGLP